MAPALADGARTAGEAAYLGFMVARDLLTPAGLRLMFPTRTWAQLRPDERQAFQIIGTAVIGWWGEPPGEVELAAVPDGP